MVGTLDEDGWTLENISERAERDPKFRMALVFKWYFVHSARLARTGSEIQRVDYQIHCGPALGAFNQWVKGTPHEPWRARHADEIAELLMQGAAAVVEERLRALGALPTVDDTLTRRPEDGLPPLEMQVQR